MVDQKKECGLFALMTDIVCFWANDLALDGKVSREEFQDLHDRLMKANKILNKKYSCSKARIYIPDAE